jgi:predicted porin
MNRKLLPTMVGLILAGGVVAAQADVTVFGHIDTSLDFTDQDGGDDNQNFNCTTCSIGFKGSEDLGNGLKAIFLLDFQYNTTERNPQTATFQKVKQGTATVEGPSTTYTTTTKDGVGKATTNNGLTDRDQWLGLAGNFGQVRVGTISTVYKSHGALLDPFYRTALQGRDRGLQSRFHSFAGENLQGRATNTARYDSPDWNGLNVGAFYTLDSNEDDGYGGKEDNDPYGMGASYANGGLLVFADYMDNDGSDSDVGGDIWAWKAGGKYSLGMFEFTGQYEESSTDEDSAAAVIDVDTTVWFLGASATLGNTMAYFAYGQGEFDFADGPSEDYTSWTLALMHHMSKQTLVYTGFNEVDCDKYVAGSVCDRVGGSGGEDDKFSIGMKHLF